MTQEQKEKLILTERAFNQLFWAKRLNDALVVEFYSKRDDTAENRLELIKVIIEDMVKQAKDYKKELGLS